MAVPYKRALVLSGGGAKGVFEAGVLKACHHTGMTFDVLTGSSIGAIKDAARRARSARQAEEIYHQTHDVFVVFLGPKPEITELPHGQAQQMLAYEYGLRAFRDVDTGAPHGWRCTNTACRVRDVCTRI